MHKSEHAFEIISVAADIQGPEVVKPYIKGTTFTTLVDTGNVMANEFGFDILPNGIFVDEQGTIRLIKQGFRVSEENHIEALEQLIRGEVNKVELDDIYYETKKSTSDLEKQLSQTKFTLALEYVKQGKKKEAIKELDEALLLDSTNFLIRKQRWYIRYPEKFSPTIDIEWQQHQLEQERAEENALKEELDCGPEGCVIPGTNK